MFLEGQIVNVSQGRLIVGVSPWEAGLIFMIFNVEYNLQIIQVDYYSHTILLVLP